MRDTVHPAFEQLQLELAEALVAAAIGVRGERADDDAAGDRRAQRPGDFAAIEAENQDVDTLSRLLDGVDDRRHSTVGLNDELHSLRLLSGTNLDSVTST